MALELRLVGEEVVTNVAKYAYAPGAAATRSGVERRPDALGRVAEGQSPSALTKYVALSA